MIPSKIKIKILALRRIFAALGSKGLKSKFWPNERNLSRLA